MECKALKNMKIGAGRRRGTTVLLAILGGALVLQTGTCVALAQRSLAAGILDAVVPVFNETVDQAFDAQERP